MAYQYPYYPQYSAYQPSPPLQYSMNTQAQQPIHGFVYVTGLEGAKAYQMPPNSEMPLFDSTNDGVMFVKTTDGAGFPTISIVDCNKRDAKAAQQPTEYVTHNELERVYSDLSAQLEQMKEAVYGSVSTTSAAQHGAGRHSDAQGQSAGGVQ